MDDGPIQEVDDLLDEQGLEPDQTLWRAIALLFLLAGLWVAASLNGWQF